MNHHEDLCVGAAVAFYFQSIFVSEVQLQSLVYIFLPDMFLRPILYQLSSQDFVCFQQVP